MKICPASSKFGSAVAVLTGGNKCQNLDSLYAKAYFGFLADEYHLKNKMRHSSVCIIEGAVSKCFLIDDLEFILTFEIQSETQVD
jgi:hypothetical protein